MKAILKYSICILFTIILMAFAFFGFLKSDATPLSLMVRCPQNTGTKELALFDAGDGNYYVFVPSYAGMEDIIVEYVSKQKVFLDGVQIYTGMNFQAFELSTPYSFKIGSKQVTTLWFYKSASIPAMHIDTASGTMNNIHADKECEEYASVNVYAPTGDADCVNLTAKLKGRGNTTWTADKKPYTLSLEEGRGFLGMGASEKWILLANGYDRTSLRNKLVFDFANTISNTKAWAPEAAFVDLFLNGEYAGIYLLCYKPDAGANHLNLDAEDFFFELTFTSRLKKPEIAIPVCNNIYADILSPADCDEKQKIFLEQQLTEFQEAIYSESGISPTSGRSYTEYINMESWARKYLIEEVFSNFDGGKTSQFFWYDNVTQKINAGPCWDYDYALGQFFGTQWTTPNCLLVQRNWGTQTSWFNALYQKEEFKSLVVELYKTEFRPLLQQYVENGIANVATTIEQAAEMDAIRWKSQQNERSWKTMVDELQQHLKLRVGFLDLLWIDRADFYKITLHAEATYNLCVPADTVCTTLPQPSDFGVEGIWVLEGTELPFNEGQPITEDITLAILSSDANNGTPPNPEKSSITMLEWIVLLSAGMLGLLLLCFIGVDLFRRYKDRRNTHG